MQFCNGKYAKFVCSRCGFTNPYTTRKKEISGLIVCSECYDGKLQNINHPLNQPYPKFDPDSVLKSPRPDVSVAVAIPVSSWSII